MPVNTHPFGWRLCIPSSRGPSDVVAGSAQERVDTVSRPVVVLSLSARMLRLSLKAIVASKVESNGIVSLMVIVYPIMVWLSRKK